MMSRHWVRIVAAGFVTLLSGGLTAPTAQAEDPRPPVSVAPAPIVLSGDTGTAKVSNQTGLTLRVELVIVDANGNAVGNVQLQPGASPSTSQALDPAATASVELSVKSTDDPRAVVVRVRPVAGVLPSGWVVRTPVVRTAPARPAVKKWVSIRTDHPSGSSYGDTDNVPLNGECAGLGITDGATVGVVSARGEPVPVTASCPSATATEVDLGFTGHAPVGVTFTGTVDLVPNDDEAGEVDVSLATTYGRWVLWVALTVSLLVALAAERWVKAGRDVTLLRADLKDVRQSLASLDGRFEKATRDAGLNEPITGWKAADELTAEVTTIEKALERAWAKPRNDSLGAQAKAIANSVSAWPLLPGQLAALNVNRERLRLAPRISDLLWNEVTAAPADWTSENVRERAAKVVEHNAFTLKWPATRLDALHAKWLGVDHEKTPRTNILFEGLQVADDPSGTLSRLQNEIEPCAAEVEVAPRSPAARVDQPASPVPTVVEAPSRTFADQARSLRRTALAVDWVLLLLTAAIAFLTGMAAFPTPDEVIGARQVLATILWGLVGGTVVGPLSEALARVGGSVARLSGDERRPSHP